MKKAGVIIISILIVILLLLVTTKQGCGRGDINREYVTSKSSSKQKPIVNHQSSQQTDKSKVDKSTETEPMKEQKINNEEKSNKQVIEDIISNSKILSGLEEVSEETIPYKQEYISEKVKIAKKSIYTDGSQLYYLLVLSPVSEKSDIETLGYFVSYSTYKDCNINDVLDMEYERFSNKIISINLIMK